MLRLLDSGWPTASFYLYWLQSTCREASGSPLQHERQKGCLLYEIALICNPEVA